MTAIINRHKREGAEKEQHGTYRANENMQSSFFFRLRNISFIRKYLTPNSAKIIIQALALDCFQT